MNATKITIGFEIREKDVDGNIIPIQEIIDSVVAHLKKWWNISGIDEPIIEKEKK